MPLFPQASHLDGQMQLVRGLYPLIPPFRKEAFIRNRPIKLSVRVNQTENQYLTLQAHSSGLSKEAFIRKLIMGETIKAKPPQELAELLRLLKSTSDNINQIARSVNAGIAKAEDARRGLYLLEQVYELMHEVAKK